MQMFQENEKFANDQFVNITENLFFANNSEITVCVLCNVDLPPVHVFEI